MAARSLTGPFTAKGDAKLAGILAHFDVAVGRLGVGPTDLQLLINMAGDAAILKFDGTADQAAATLKGKLDAKIAEPGVLLQIAGARGLPPALTKPFTLTSSIEATAHSTSCPNRVSLGDDKATGKIAAHLGSPVLVDASLDFARLDLDKLLPETQPALQSEGSSGVAAAPAPRHGAAPTAPAAPAAPAPVPAGFLLPPGIAASLDLSAESIVYRKKRPSSIPGFSPISPMASWRSSNSRPVCRAARTSASPAPWRARTVCRSSSGRCRRNRRTSAS